MHENGTYSPKMGRPVNDVNYIRESMAVPQPKTTLRELGPEQDATRPSTATELLDDLFKSIESLEMETAGLFAQIDYVLTEGPEQCQPMPGPRTSSSVLTYRIAHAADLIDELTNRVNRIRNRITL